MTQTDNIISDHQMNDIEIAMDKESKKNLIIDQINKLYDNTIYKFQTANLLIYRPHIFSRLTKQKFIEWIVMNNTDIAELFD